MKLTHRLWQSSIYKRLFIAFIAATIPIYILAGILYSWASSLLRKDIVDSAETQSENYISGLNGTLDRFNSLQYDMLNDTYLIQLVNAYDILEPYRKIELIHFLRAKLVSIRNSSDLIVDTRLYLSNIGIEISAVDGYGLMKEDVITPAMLNDPYNIISYNDSLLIVAYPLESEYKDTPEIIVEIELRSSELKRGAQAALEKEFTGALVLGLGSNANNIIAVADDKLEQPIKEHYRKLVKVESESSNELPPADLDKDYIFVHSDLTESRLYVDHYLYKPTMFRTISEYIQWFWLFFGATVMMVALYLYYINRVINKPMVKLVRAFKRVEEGNFELNIRHDKDDEFGYLYERFNEMLINMKVSIDEVYNQQIHRQNAELKQLQSQINPHFLYNCLFSIIRLIKMQKDEEAVQFTNQLAKYFQFITRNKRDTVPLENEASHARNYVMLQLARFSDRVSVEFGEVPDSLKPLSVPRLIIQPLVENAFVHGLENVTEGGMLRVSFLDEWERAVVVVEDNGEDSDNGLAKLNALLTGDQEAQEITGILNVHKRLQYSYGAGSGLRASRSELGGLKIELIIERKGAMADVSDVNRG